MSNTNIEIEKKIETQRSREWIFILYPESAPDNWQERLRALQINFVISPIHDKDVDDNGNLKKAHYHILLSFASKKSYKQIEDITSGLNQPFPMICHDKSAQIRYFVHKDDPEKYQYDIKDIQTYGRVDLDTYFKFTTEDELSIVDAMLDYCEENGITEYFQLIDYVRKNNRDWFRYLNKNSFVVKEYLKSKHFHLKEENLGQKRNALQNASQLAREIENLNG